MPLAIDFQGGISNAWSNVIAFVPRLAAALLIILVAILIVVIAATIAKAVSDLLSSLLSSVSGGPVMAKGAGIAILVFGAFAALDQLKIAPRIVTGLWYAILAILVGSAVVSIGGGGIKPMQRYWERATAKAEQRGPELEQTRQSAQASVADGDAAAYAGATDQFEAQRPSRPPRDPG